MSNNTPDFELYRKIYNNEQQNIVSFYPDEIDAVRDYPDYVQEGIVKDSIDLLVDFSKISQGTYTFSSPALTNQFEEFRSKSDYNQKVEYTLRDLHIYGNAYSQVVREDDEVNVYTPQPDHCFAEYDEFNPQKKAKYTGIEIEVEKDDKKYKLRLKYFSGEIAIEATDEKDEKVNPLQAFEEVLSDKDVRVRKNKEGEQEYFISTGATYPLLQLARINKPASEFYGRSVISKAVISKLAYINRLNMLERHSLFISANPKLQLSEDGAKIISQAIEEATSNTSEGIRDIGDIMSNDITPKTIWSVSWLRSATAGFINKKLNFFTSNGRGDNKYIVNNYSLEDLRLARTRAIQDIRSDLKISPALVETEMSTGAKSGIAYKRLMQKTVNHVENLREVITPHLQRLAITVLELENGTKYSELPTIEYPEILEDDEANQRLNRLTERLNNA